MEEIEKENNNEWNTMQSTPLAKHTFNRPVYVNRQDGLNLYPSSIGTIDLSYIKRPATVQWGYVVINDKALYNDNISVDFELHSSEESELVNKILLLAGVAIKQQELAQTAAGMETSKQQQEKI